MPGFLPPPVRVSVDSLDTLNIPGSSMDAWLPTPLLPPPPRQSIHGFPGYSEHPWVIHGCLNSYSPSLIDIVEYLVTLNIESPLCLVSSTSVLSWDLQVFPDNLDYPWNIFLDSPCVGIFPDKSECFHTVDRTRLMNTSTFSEC